MKQDKAQQRFNLVMFIAIIWLFFANYCAAQEPAMDRIQAPDFSIQITQDGRLAFLKDDHGNEPFTADLHIKLQAYGYVNKKGGAVYLAIKHQYADLASGNLNRWGVEAGYSFPVVWTKRDHFDDRPLVKITPLVGYGRIRRENDYARDSWELGADISLEVTRWFSLVLGQYVTDRREYNLIRYNVNAGIKITP